MPWRWFQGGLGKGFGWADEAGKVPATADTLYQVGAPAKILTATEVLKLWEEGKIGLDKPIQKYIPDFSIQNRFKKTKPITVRALLANHSGLSGFFLKGLWVKQPESLQQFVEDLKSDYMVSPPQTLYKYSYVDYDLLGRLVEIKRRKIFSDAMQEDLLGPLGMDSSTFENEPRDKKVIAKGYRNGLEVTQAHFRDVPAAGLISSVSDMAKFLQFILADSPQGEYPPSSQKRWRKCFNPSFRICLLISTIRLAWDGP